MTMIRNNAPGPRIFNLAGGAKNVVTQRTLVPGEVADLDLLVEPDKDPVLKAWLTAKEIEIVSGDVAAAGFNAEEFAEAQVKVAEATADMAKQIESKQAADMDVARLTPPRQFGGDGGPEQMPTVDGNGGAPTAAQEEAAKAGGPKAEPVAQRGPGRPPKAG